MPNCVCYGYVPLNSPKEAPQLCAKIHWRLYRVIDQTRNVQSSKAELLKSLQRQNFYPIASYPGEDRRQVCKHLL